MYVRVVLPVYELDGLSMAICPWVLVTLHRQSGPVFTCRTPGLLVVYPACAGLKPVTVQAHVRPSWLMGKVPT